MKTRTFALFLVAGTALAGAALADPPGRVGRISYVEGDVSFLPPGETDWTYAVPNFPVTDSESFWTDDNGRAEIQVGAMEIRADSQTELDVLALHYGETRLAVTQGSIDVRLWRLPEGGVTIATPAGDVMLNQPGVYRIDVGAADDQGDYPPAEVTVFDGDASTPGASGYSDLASGGAAILYAGYDPQFQQAQDASIDDWAREREQAENWARSADNDAAFTGYQDLAGQGQFVENADYGTVWFPSSVPGDWAPYRYGHWAYVAPWGYTWIDDQPWGFAPFHYGRWVQVGGRWGWVRGQGAVRPVYAPALVAFVGGGGVGAIGWIPLGPDEVYRPSYRVSADYYRRVNVTNVSVTTFNRVTINNTINITEYRNAAAAVAVAPQAFAGGQRIGRAATPLSAAGLAGARPAAAAALPPPTAEARSGFRPNEGAPGGRQPAPPPAHLQAVRAAVAAQPAGSSHPPAIPGAHMAPPGSTGPRTGPFVAPAQVKNPTAQAQHPVTPPVGGSGHTGGPAYRPAPNQLTPQPTNRPEPGYGRQQPAGENGNHPTPPAAGNEPGNPPRPTGESGYRPTPQSPAQPGQPLAQPERRQAKPSDKPHSGQPPAPQNKKPDSSQTPPS